MIFPPAVTRQITAQLASVSALLSSSMFAVAQNRLTAYYDGHIPSVEATTFEPLKGFVNAVTARVTDAFGKLPKDERRYVDAVGLAGVLGQIKLGNFADATRKIKRQVNDLTVEDYDAIAAYAVNVYSLTGTPRQNPMTEDVSLWVAQNLAGKLSPTMTKALRSHLIWNGRAKVISNFKEWLGSDMTPLEREIMLSSAGTTPMNKVEFAGLLPALQSGDLSESSLVTCGLRMLIQGDNQSFQDAVKSVKRTSSSTTQRSNAA